MLHIALMMMMIVMIMMMMFLVSSKTMLHIALSVRRPSAAFGEMLQSPNDAAWRRRCSTSPSEGLGSWPLRRRCSADGPPSGGVWELRPGRCFTSPSGRLALVSSKTMLHIASVGESGEARQNAPKTIWGHAFKHQRWLMERRQTPSSTGDTPSNTKDDLRDSTRWPKGTLPWHAFKHQKRWSGRQASPRALGATASTAAVGRL